MANNEENPELSLAYQYIEQTNKNLFLTGKAGTGKTTFLRNLTKTTSKRFVVLAPTGVAALQAGGVTLHSFFQLPLHIYVPGTVPQTRRFKKSKINLIRSLDLIIIDEISMVRADLLDEIDFLLRRFRYNSHDKPFGGVQLLLIGDLSQLPPIYSEEEYNELSTYYHNFYFFNSLALQKSNYVTLTLTHIYRQRDEHFINVLNAIRDNNITPQIIAKLNTRYKPDIVNNIPDGFITLCTHNNQADSINLSKLEALDTEDMTYVADIEGDFPESIYPNSEKLTLKVDSQVMFLKNDYSSKDNYKIKSKNIEFALNSNQKRYYNGKIGRVKKLGDSCVVVQCEGDNEPVKVEKYVWQNVRYIVDKKTKVITEEVIGTFEQFPLRLAWAVTIHKSQGLTFDKVIINSNKAFSHGQVYVALSRCRTLDGVVLTNKFDSSSVILDNSITKFNKDKLLNPPSKTTLHIDEQEFLIENIISVFDFSTLTNNLQNLEKFIKESLYNIFPRKSQKALSIIDIYKTEVGEMSNRFIKWLSQFLNLNLQAEENINQCILRGYKGKEYFLRHIKPINELILSLGCIELDNRDDNDELQEFIDSIEKKKEIKYRILKFFDENFTSSSYLKCRNSILVEGNSLSLDSIEEEKKQKRQEHIKDSSKEKVEYQDDITDRELFEILRQWRKDKAVEKKLPAYMIISQKGLISLTNEQPTTKQKFIGLKGLGKKTFNNYGEEILEIINSYITNI